MASISGVSADFNVGKGKKSITKGPLIEAFIGK